MSGFENYARQADEIEQELTRKGVALGIDWADEVAVHDLARQALQADPVAIEMGLDDLTHSARYELFGLAQLMLKVMQESAGEQIHTHGGPVWKAFARALWAEHETKPGTPLGSIG